ncbi:uncharacterized protein LOC125043086 [Penaeus chinensis]|uniref:uncharacterized protein LOC125043086 n=1 Tax=Penaeus chinensis TaxID=139456 RepID=UPI001FB6E304|nr:uncharacterized protein LOC125043086 [Penaeus chinensis]
MALSLHTSHAECQAIFDGSLKACATRCLVPRDGTMPVCATKENREVKWGVCTVDCSHNYCDDQCRQRIVTLDGEASWIQVVSASASSWLQVVFASASSWLQVVSASSEGAAASGKENVENQNPEETREFRRRKRTPFIPFFKGHRLKISRKYHRDKFCQGRLKQC